MKPIYTNPYENILAQTIELFNDIHYGIQLLDNKVEVPLGILFHEYKYNKKGFFVEGNCVVSTAQNHANIQDDFKKLLPELLAQDKSEEEIELALEMLVYTYDPCISRSTHYLKVAFC
ncbi:MAG: hypothetical protein HQK51_18710 [Oligoflexia bacterium]|nr:hypothetical protein [Oligoflexia bacterium]